MLLQSSKLVLVIGEIGDSIVDFATVDSQGVRRLNAEADASAFDRNDPNRNLSANDNFFAQTTGQHQHGYPSLRTRAEVGNRSDGAMAEIDSLRSTVARGGVLLSAIEKPLPNTIRPEELP
jgi:hypothetical protein